MKRGDPCGGCRVLDQQCVVPFVWVGRIIALSSRRLVPGDVVVVQRGKATCDMVLLRGAGLVEESMMSGEVRRGVTWHAGGSGQQIWPCNVWIWQGSLWTDFD